MKHDIYCLAFVSLLSDKIIDIYLENEKAEGNESKCLEEVDSDEEEEEEHDKMEDKSKS